MFPIYIVAKNTFKEIIRDRILYGIVVVSVLLLFLSLALGQLSFTEQTRIAANFGFAAIHISAVILSIFLGSTLVYREIDKKTITTVLVRPVSRNQFIIGKSLGLLCVSLICIIMIACVLAFILFGLEMPLNFLFLVGLYGIFLESIVLLGFAIFFGSFASPSLSVSFTIGIFLIGHWIDSLRYFASQSSSEGFVLFSRSISAVMPNLENFNWRSLFIYGDTIPVTTVIGATAYMLAWFVFLITLSTIILGRRDLG